MGPSKWQKWYNLEQKFELDVWYVNNISFSTDIKIVFRTIEKVLLRKDIDDSDRIGMAPFTGNDNEQ